MAEHPVGLPQLHPGTAAALANPVARGRPSPGGGPEARGGPSASPIPLTGSGALVAAVNAADVPVRVTIPSLSIQAPVVPVSVNGSGDVAIPPDIRRVGWYQWGAAPGSISGSTVLVGHVDSVAQGAGAFFPLRLITVGALVDVTTANHEVSQYRVIAREVFPKATVPFAAIFATAGVPRLTLLTCGGAFDRRTRSYRDNIVITAVPLPR